MTIEVQVYVPNLESTFTLDEFVDHLMAVAACGSYRERLVLPDNIIYNNPVTGHDRSIKSR